MKDFRYTEVATLTISREVVVKAEDNIEALDVCNEILWSGFNPDTDEVIGYKTEEWNLKEVNDDSDQEV